MGRDGYHEVLGVCEGTREDKESWRSLLRHLNARGLRGVRLFISGKCSGLVESPGKFHPEPHWQRCVVHWYRNVPSVALKAKAKLVAVMLKAIHAQEDREAVRKKAAEVVERLQGMRLGKAAETVRAGVEETLSDMRSPPCTG